MTARELVSRIRAVASEAFATARSQPVASVVSMTIVAGMCATVLLTAGRTVGAEQAVLGSIDSAGTRSIVIRADADAGLESTVLNRIAHIHGVQWAGAFGPAVDSTNSAIPNGTKVPIRHAWGGDLATLGVPQQYQPGQTWASAEALAELGLPAPAGGLTLADGSDYAVVGQLHVPGYLSFLEPLAITPTKSNRPGAVSALIVIADRPDLVAPVSKAVQSVLSVDDPAKITVSSSQSLADLRALVQTQLGSFSQSLILLTFGLSGILVAAILYGLVVMRRKDFGRRRALGAAQSLIVSLVLSQIVMLAAAGATAGSVISAIALAVARNPLPPLEYFVAVAFLAITIAVLAAVFPAVAAARRDPLTELRVP